MADKKVRKRIEVSEELNLTFVPMGPFVDSVDMGNLNEIPVFSPAWVIDRRELSLAEKVNGWYDH